MMQQTIPERPLVDARESLASAASSRPGSVTSDGISADDKRRTAARDDRAVTIEDHPARRRDGNEADLICLRRRTISRAVDELNYHEPRDQRKQRKDDHRAECHKTPRRKLPRPWGAGRSEDASSSADVEAAHDEHRRHDHDGVERRLQSASWKCIVPRPGG